MCARAKILPRKKKQKWLKNIHIVLLFFYKICIYIYNT